MKPYEVEIFDRKFNYLFNALVDEKDFNYKYDIISPEKNTIPITKDFKPSTLSNENGVPKGWYIRITRDNEEYQGVITGFEENENLNKITISQAVALFDIDITVLNSSGVNVDMEKYIADTLTNNFLHSDDIEQNIRGLSISRTSSTVGTFKFATKETGYESINIMEDVIGEAISNEIGVSTVFNYEAKTITVSIGKIGSGAEKIIEGDLPNIISPEFTVKKSSGELNKVDITDTYLGSKYLYYLHPDGSYDLSNTDRILPINNKAEHFDSYDIAQKQIDATFAGNVDRVEALIQAPRDLTNEEAEFLQNANYGNALSAHGYWFVDRVVHSDVVAADYGSIMEYFAYTHKSVSLKLDNVLTVGIYDVVLRKYTSYPNYSTGYLAVTIQWNNYKYHTDHPNYNGIKSRTSLTYPSAMRSDHRGQSGTAEVTTYTGYSRSHLVVEEEVDYDLYINVKVYPTYTDLQNDTNLIEEETSTRAMETESVTPLYFSDVSKGMNQYKGSDQYYADIRSAAPSVSRSQAALIAASDFASNKYQNLIELTVKKDDSMIKPLEMEIGQVVNVIHEGISYSSILTGKEVKGGLIKLIFGTIRLELTKILNMKGV